MKGSSKIVTNIYQASPVRCLQLSIFKLSARYNDYNTLCSTYWDVMKSASPQEWHTMNHNLPFRTISDMNTRYVRRSGVFQTVNCVSIIVI